MRPLLAAVLSLVLLLQGLGAACQARTTLAAERPVHAHAHATADAGDCHACPDCGEPAQDASSCGSACGLLVTLPTLRLQLIASIAPMPLRAEPVAAVAGFVPAPPTPPPIA